MKNPAAIRERYLGDPLPIRLGGLAANPARVESFSDHPDHGAVIKRLLEENKYFIEWTAFEASPPLQAELVELQLAQWQHQWEQSWADPARRATVAEQADAWSKRVLERLGFLAQKDR